MTVMDSALKTRDNAKTRAPRKRRLGSPVMIACQIALGVAILAFWQIGASTGFLDPFFFSDPVSVATRIYDWFTSGSIYTHLIATGQATLLSFVIGAVLGLLFGTLLGRVHFLERLFDPYIKMFNAMPRLLLAPIFLLWFGLGIGSKIALGVTLVFFLVFFNTLEAMKGVSRPLIDNSRMLGASEWQLLKTVYLPSALGLIFSSLHSSIGFAIIGVVTGEYMGAFRGIGYVIAQSQGTFDTTGVFAGMVTLMVFVLVIEFFIGKAERRLLAWRSVGRN
ncbi:ABC transporter permease [Rhodococcoides kyotonense]|uniref:NitT/TauT family transport system permease protein n=1 Tax=Rhodococcoides kyotonense TaxID=398843 RepID=A0A239LHN2_9NOCA|nr:ABC transporter permease [Rhodococcus kyotonensis]SNT29408.1 NitT/TauT family transport system permease protein [Rhodococcus kyotonensis]